MYRQMLSKHLMGQQYNLLFMYEAHEKSYNIPKSCNIKPQCILNTQPSKTETRMTERLQEVGGRVTPGAVTEELQIFSSTLTFLIY